jgi:hypothetical protein
MEFIFLQGKSPSYAIVKNWVGKFKRGNFFTPVDQIHELILEDRRTWTKSIAEEVGISRERVGSVIHQDLYMRKIPK